MPQNKFYYGEERLMYIKYNEIFVVVGCLTTQDISESTIFIPTMTRENNGWKTSRPISQEYSINFTGLQVLTGGINGNPNVLSYDRLKTLKRALTLIEWRIEAVDNSLIDSGFAHISEIGEAAPVDDWLTFSVALIGFGLPQSEINQSNGTITGGGGYPSDFLNTPTDLTGFSFPVGFATKNSLLSSSAGYRGLIAKHAKTMTPENELKIEGIRPTESTWNFSSADTAVAYSQANSLFLHGHTLIWAKSSGLPDWIDAYEGNVPAMQEILRLHVTTVVTRYKGKVRGWDVINEALNDNGTYRSQPFYNTLGTQFIIDAFRYAQEADPNAILLINDYGQEYGNANKTNALIAMAKMVKAAGVRCDGIGFQMHTRYGQSISMFRARIKMVADAGLMVHVSELDIMLRNGQPAGFIPDAALLLLQANYYRDVFKGFIDMVPAAQRYALTMWAVADHNNGVNAGISSSAPALKDYPMMFDRLYAPKLAINKVLGILTGSTGEPVYPRPIMGDNFNKVDGALKGTALTLGTATGVWESDNINGLQISGGTVKGKSQTTESVSWFTYNALNYKAFFYIDKLSTDANNRRIYAVFRYVDKDNFFSIEAWAKETWKLKRKLNGVTKTLKVTSKTPSSSDIISINVLSNVIEFAINDVIQYTDNETNLASSNKIGLKSYGIRDNNSAWKGLRVYNATQIVTPPGTVPPVVIETPIYSDDFNRPDGLLKESELSNGYQLGQWVTDSRNGLEVDSTQVKARTGIADSCAWVETDLTSYKVRATVGRLFANDNRRMFVIFRHRDINNFWAIFCSGLTGTWKLQRKVNDVEVTIFTSTVTPAVGDIVGANVTEESIIFVINNVEVFTTTDTSFFGDSNVGLKSVGTRDNNSRWDNFEIYDF